MIQERLAPLPTIAADRIVLRPLQATDASLIARHLGDVRVAEGTRAIPHPLPADATQAYVQTNLDKAGPEDIWVMDGSARGLDTVLGVVSLTHIDRDQSEVVFWVAPAHWNAGYASEAVAAIVAANPHRARALFAVVFQDNPGSARVLTNCGFEYLGDAEAFSAARGRVVATWTYMRKMG